MLLYSGADTLSEGIGQLAMINNDTAKGSLVFYALKQGTPPQVKQIWVWDGTIKFSGPDTYDVDGTTFVYSADADADGDGRPDPGAVPLFPSSDAARGHPRAAVANALATPRRPLANSRSSPYTRTPGTTLRSGLTRHPRSANPSRTSEGSYLFAVY